MLPGYEVRQSPRVTVMSRETCRTVRDRQEFPRGQVAIVSGTLPDFPPVRVAIRLAYSTLKSPPVGGVEIGGCEACRNQCVVILFVHDFCGLWLSLRVFPSLPPSLARWRIVRAEDWLMWIIPLQIPVVIYTLIILPTDELIIGGFVGGLFNPLF